MTKLKMLDLSVSPRVIALIDPGFMFSADRTLGFLCVPADMDLMAEQKKFDDMRWGLDNEYRDFFAYLLDQENVNIFPIEYYHIRYQNG